MKKTIVNLLVFSMTVTSLVHGASTKKAEVSHKEAVRVAGALAFQSKNANTFSVFVKGFC